MMPARLIAVILSAVRRLAERSRKDPDPMSI